MAAAQAQELRNALNDKDDLFKVLDLRLT